MDDYDPFSGNVQLKQLPFSTNVSNQCNVEPTQYSLIVYSFQN